MSFFILNLKGMIDMNRHTNIERKIDNKKVKIPAIDILAVCMLGIILILSEVIKIELCCMISYVFILIITSNMILMAMNTRKIGDNNDVNFLSIAFVPIIIFYSINRITCSYISNFSNNAYNIEFYFLAVGTYLEAISMFIVIKCKGKKIDNIKLIMSYLLMFFVLIGYGIINRDIFNFVDKNNVYNVTSQCIIFIGLMMVVFTYAELINGNVILDNFGFKFTSMYFVFEILSVLSIFVTSLTGLKLMGVTLICKAISMYCLYKSMTQRILKDPYGNLFSKLKVSHDMLQKENLKRKEMQMQLHERKEEYEKLINSMPYGVLAYYEGKYVFTNKAAVNLLHCKSRNQILCKNVLDFVHPSYIDKFRVRMKLEEKQIVMPPMEARLKCIDGEEIDAEISWGRFLYKNETTSLLIINDITEKKRLEKLEKEITTKEELLIRTLEYDKLKTDFFANLSHELRTPINIIFTSLQLMDVYIKKENLKNKDNLEKSILRMRQNSYRLLRLVNNLIDITKIDAGYFKINPKNLDIIHLIKSIVISVEEYVKSKQLSITFSTDVEKLIMNIDPDSIERILLNLISNAIKFTPKNGEIQVIINKTEVNDFNMVRLTIRDTGIGIPQDKLDNVFDRFVQVDKSFIRKTEGSGIGLSLVKSLVEMHGGSISVQSKLNEGSEFSIELPIRIIEDDVEEECAAEKEEKVERINIEFSDIYN